MLLFSFRNLVKNTPQVFHWSPVILSTCFSTESDVIVFYNIEERLVFQVSAIQWKRFSRMHKT